MPRASRQPHAVPRLVAENVEPQVDAGRHPAKRAVGDTVRVGVDLYKDGHDLLAGRVRFRGPGRSRWRSTGLAYAEDEDRWFASFQVDRPGRWEFCIEAWPDAWATWRRDLGARVAAGQAVGPELLEGAALLRRAAKNASQPARLEQLAARLADAAEAEAKRVGLALADAAASLVEGPVDPRERLRLPSLPLIVDRPRAIFGAWYELFPRSQSPVAGRHGRFDDAARRLPELAELGFDVVYLPPIHPIGRAHRKGPNNAPQAGPGDLGSPWAIGAEEGGHTAVHPELGSLADFERFVDRARSLGLDVALDYALQCSPDHPWAREHPEWFHVRPDGTIRYAENPPKRYQDIYPLNFWCEQREELWGACLDVLRFWIERGVRIFRVDNPHTKPFAFWEWALGEVRREHPDVIFLSEAFTRPKRMYGLAKLGFNQSYTYFTWKNTSWELRDYLTELTRPPVSEFFRPNFFANTPDILHEFLQRGGRPAFRIRLLLAATLSPSYGIYSGFELCENLPLRPGSEEYMDSEKYQLRQRNWDAPGHLKDDLRRLNQLRREWPALQRLCNLSFLPCENESVLWYRKAAPEGDLLIAVLLDPHQPQETRVELPLDAFGLTESSEYEVEDLLDGARYRWRGARNYLRLEPEGRVGHVLRLVAPA